MLPSVSAGSAALTKYAQAVAIAAPEEAPRDSDATPRPEQEAARQNAEKQSVPTPVQDSLARDARATVEAVLDLLHTRVLTALIDLGASEETALKAANAATAQLAGVLAGESRHAAEIVHALLENIQTGQATRPERLLQFVAKGLVVVIDHVSGDVRVTPPQFDLQPNNVSPRPSSAPHHLLDFTDYSADKAAPVIQALGAVHEAANSAIDAAVAETAASRSPVPAPAAFIVAPDAFVRPLTTQLSDVLAPTGFSVSETASTVSRALSQAIASAVNGGGASQSVPVAEIMAAARQMKPVTPAGDDGNAPTDGRISLAAGKVAVALDTATGAITVQVGTRTVAFAPASLPAPTAATAPLPGLNAGTVPASEIFPRLPVGKIIDQPAGVPFVPPAFDDAPSPIGPQAPGQVPEQPPTSASAATLRMQASVSVDESTRLLDPAVMRNATIMRSLGPVAGSDIPALTRIALDISAEIAPGAAVALNPPKVGRFGLPKPAPVQSEEGPVLKHGYADASANLPPVLPAVHMRAPAETQDIRQKPKHRRKQLPAGKYRSLAIDDAFTRDVPAEHQGLVFSSVVFSV